MFPSCSLWTSCQSSELVATSGVFSTFGSLPLPIRQSPLQMALWLYDPEDNESRENGEEDKANRAMVTVKNAVEDLEPPHTSSDQSRGEGEGEGVSWVNPRKHPAPATKDDSEGRRKVYSNMEDDTKSILTIFDAKDNAKSVPAFFDDSELVSTPTDPNVTLSKGQCSYNLAEMVNTRGIPYQEGNSPPTHVPMGTSPVATLTIPVATQLIGKMGVTLSEAVKRDFRDLGGTKDMRLACRKEDEDLLGWEDPGGVSQHRMEGYMPMVDEEAVPWINPREHGVKTLRGREAEEKNAAENLRD